jgi:hypothetical protein
MPAAGHSDIAGVNALFLDSARVASIPDGTVVSLDQEGQASDEIATTLFPVRLGKTEAERNTSWTPTISTSKRRSSGAR